MTTTTTSPRYLRLTRRSSIKTRFAYRFLGALRKLNKHKKPNSQKQHTVKLAAYASMASAVGSKRAWSRALLWKIRNRAMTRNPATKRSSRSRRSLDIFSRRVEEENPIMGFGSCTNELRKLVPGGEVMEFNSLLDETAHYIKCLTSQVQVMKDILDRFSP